MRLLAISLLAGCELDAGTLGGEGPAGPTGPAGVDAPVPFSSDWIRPTGFTAVPDLVPRVFTVAIDAPEIDRAVLDGGSVTVYAQLGGYSEEYWPRGTVQQMPITLLYDVYGPLTDHWSARISEGTIEIEFVNSADFYDSIAEEHDFRYVVTRPQ